MPKQEQCKGKPRIDSWGGEVGVLECLIQDEGEDDEDEIACLETEEGKREEKGEVRREEKGDGRRRETGGEGRWEGNKEGRRNEKGEEKRWGETYTVIQFNFIQVS